MLSLEQQLTACSLISWIKQSQATLPPKAAAIVAQWLREVEETLRKEQRP